MEGLLLKVCILHGSGILLDSDSIGMYVILKMVSFDGNMLHTRPISGILTGNLESSLIFFIDIGLKLFGNDVGPGVADTACQGWMRGLRREC